MSVTWHFRGYDRETEFLGSDIGIGPAKRAAARRILRESAHDPDVADPHELTPDQAHRLAAALGVSIDLARFDWFVETQQDWRDAATQRDAMLAQA